MRTFFFVSVLLIGAIVALGFYRGWFSLNTTQDPETGRQGVQFQVDHQKIKPDIEKVKQKVAGSTQGRTEPDGQQP